MWLVATILNSAGKKLLFGVLKKSILRNSFLSYILKPLGEAQSSFFFALPVSLPQSRRNLDTSKEKWSTLLGRKSF